MKPPWHLWLIGLLSLLWNAGGAFDYLMMKTGNAAYLAQLTAAQRAFYEGYPLWVNIAWGLGVWGAVLGSLLLLLRSRLAIHAFALSLLGMAGNFAWGFVISPTPMTALMADAGAVPLLFTVAIVVIAVLLLVYAIRMTQKGHLR